ncbi:MAG: hypothetical protein IKB98_02830 [Clostridia bacterium]|nr:hypothetical protein [Clostridia bacterium]
MDQTWQIIVSVVTAFAAIVALVISIIQISKSNKQSLFERRLNAYLKIRWLKSLCDENNSLKENYLKEAKEGPILVLDMLFSCMTNNSYLEEIQPVINHVLEPEWQRKYLFKIEELRSLCEEVRLIFPENIGYSLADFIFYYEETLVSMYKYQIALNHLEKECKELNRPLPTDDSLENNCRSVVVKNIEGTFELSERLFKEGTLEKAKKVIKL